MNENHECRILRIEPLESRTLLAGNLFAGDDIALDLFGDDAASSGLQQSVEGSQTQEVRSIGNNNGTNLPETTGASQPNTDPDLAQNSAFNFASQATAGETPSQDQPTQQASSVEVANRLPIAAVDAAIAAFTASEPPKAAEATISSVTQTTSELAIEQISESSVVSSIQTSQRQFAPFTPILSVAVQEPSDGLIELPPSNLDQPLDDPQDDSHLPWQFDLTVLPQIRSAIERASDHRAEITDAAIASWFCGPSGMIAVDQVLLPARPVIAAVDWLDVQLEATVRLHRSLELIASGKALPISGVALDAIMASLSDMAESQVQPIDSSHPIEIPKLAYSALAILTTGVIAARRKRRHSEPIAPAVPLHR